MSKLSIGMCGLIVAVFVIAGMVVYKSSRTARVDYQPPTSQPQRKPDRPPKAANTTLADRFRLALQICAHCPDAAILETDVQRAVTIYNAYAARLDNPGRVFNIIAWCYHADADSSIDSWWYLIVQKWGTEKDDLDRLCRHPMPEEERRRSCYVHQFVPVEPEDLAPQRRLTAQQAHGICAQAGFEYDNVAAYIEDEQTLKHLYASREGHRLDFEDSCRSSADSSACVKCYHAVIDHVWIEAKSAAVAAQEMAERPNLGWTFADVRRAFHKGAGYEERPGQGVNETAKIRWVASPTRGYIDKFDVYFESQDDSDQFVKSQVFLAAYMVGEVSSSWTWEEVEEFIASTAAQMVEEGRTEGKIRLIRDGEQMLMIALAENGRTNIGIGVSAIDPESK